MKNSVIYISLAALAVGLFASCKKTSTQNDNNNIVFTVDISGDTVRFLNTTTNASSYKWDFGDGSATSTEASPTHIYPGRGKYVPTVTVTFNDASVQDGSTVLKIQKTSPIRLNDNSLSDWDTISVYSYAFNDAKNAAKKVKLDYDVSNIYLYVEMNNTGVPGAATTADKNIFDIFMNTNGQASTIGFTPSSYSWVGEGGFNALIEGQVVQPIPADQINDYPQQAGLFYYAGTTTSNSFSWGAAGGGSQPIPPNMYVAANSSIYQLGTVQTSSDGTTKFEAAIKRNSITQLTSGSMYLGISMMDGVWDGVGLIPAANSPVITITMN